MPHNCALENITKNPSCAVRGSGEVEDEVVLIHWLVREVKDAGHSVKLHGGGLGPH